MMGRPPKNEAAPPTKTQVSAQDFTRTRDSVITGLTTLQTALQDFTRPYIAHSNALLTGTPSENDLLALSNPFGGNGFKMPGQGGGAGRSEPGRRKRTKRPHDPNAPKRPLTPYFLYMQSARPVISADLGENVTKGKVSEEGTRRWQHMPADERELWKDAYAKSLERYRAEKAAYLATLKGSDGAAAQLAAENGELVDDDDEEEDDVEDQDADMDADVDDMATQGGIAYDGHPSVLPQPASPRANKRRKSNAGDLVAPVADMGKMMTATTPRTAPPAPVRETRVLPPGTELDPAAAQKAEPKRKKRAAKDADAADTQRVGDDKERRSKRKRKSDAVVEI